MATIDERLEALVGRHEALSGTVEIIAQMQMKTDERMTELTLVMKAIAQAHLEHEDAIARLALIAGSHDNRISDLEGEAE
jgi:hypothetical protein